MSKKKKKKFDKKLVAQKLRELETEIEEPKVKTAPKKIEEKMEVKLNQADKLILSDIKKVAFVLLVVVAIFAVLFFVNLKTDYLLRASDKILTLLHVGQL